MGSRRAGLMVIAAASAVVTVAGCTESTSSQGVSKATGPVTGTSSASGSASASTPGTSHGTAPGSPGTSAGKTPGGASSGPRMTLKVSGNATLKVTRITLKGAINSTVHAPATLSVTIDPSVQFGYTITAVRLGGTITSCVATTPRGTTHIKPSSGACNITYTPGG